VFYLRLFAFAALSALLAPLPRAALAQTSPAASAALQSLADAARTGPDTARTALESAVGAGLPDTLPDALLSALPVDSAPLPQNIGALVVPKPYVATPARDPQQDILFPKIAYLYVPSAQISAGGLRLFCRVHFVTPDDAALASRMARLLALAHDTLVRRTGQADWGGDTPFDVWLMRSGKAGGEQWQRNLYFYDLDAPRSSIEWIREIVHEYSHLALPAIGGYKDPEYWASGYLGERLIVRWLQRRANGPALVTQMWGDFSGAQNFDRLLIAPALALYQKIGPSPRWLARTDADGMRYLIGQALTLDDRDGAQALAAAFALLPREARAADLTDAFAQVNARHAPSRRVSAIHPKPHARQQAQ